MGTEIRLGTGIRMGTGIRDQDGDQSRWCPELHTQFANRSLPLRAAGGCNTVLGNPGPPPQPGQCWDTPELEHPPSRSRGNGPQHPPGRCGGQKQQDPGAGIPLKPPCAPQNTCASERMFITIYLQPSPHLQHAVPPAPVSPGVPLPVSPSRCPSELWGHPHPTDSHVSAAVVEPSLG